jgi:UDP-N-acetylmuramyl pentapeptide phosphotransferase/UDP-N-acetylglucosamine-1-phosphate transferase
MENMYYCVLLFVIIFSCTFFLIPKIRRISFKLNLTDDPCVRSSHLTATPSFGGVAFYISYIITLFIIQFFDANQVSLTLLVSISVLFFTGIIDDILNISAKIKFTGQFLGVAILMFQPDFRILSLQGFMGVYEIPLIASLVGSMFFLLGLINAFNLLDGIDGLSAITGIIVASFFSYIFYQLGYFYYLYISITTIATLLAFLRFNFSITKKIFMGDTGSLSIGLVLGLLTLKLMSSGNAEGNFALSFDQKQLPLLLLGVLFVPTLDTCRVMLIRAVKKESMFKPDRNHIHHIITDFGLSHRRASFSIGLVNFTVGLLMFFVITNFNILQSTFFLFGIFAASILLLFLMNKNKAALRLKIKIRKSMLRMFFYIW